MFTGIVTEVGRVGAKTSMSGGIEFRIDAPKSAPALVLGSSIAVNGVCQTVVDLSPAGFRIQAVGATLERTTFGALSTGSLVNLEPSLRIGDELGGHLVMGHVDGVGRIVEMTRRDDAVYLSIELPAELARFAAPRGSLAVDGVSLTIAGAMGNQVTFSIIPHTMEHTIAHGYRVGGTVNLEVDLLARYLDRLLAERTGKPDSFPFSSPEPPQGRAGGAGEESRKITWNILKEKFS
jgi:riboflavin synthase